MTDGHGSFSARDLAYMDMALEEARGGIRCRRCG